MLRMLLGHEAGGHSPLTRLLAVLLLIGLIGLSAPALVLVAGWIIALL